MLVCGSACRSLFTPSSGRVERWHGINQLWVGDITYIPLGGGDFLYRAMLMDRFSRRIVGWDLQDHMRETLVITALRAAIRARRPKPDLIHHTDRGGQYAGVDYREMLARARMPQSMNRADDCYDNAFMKSCFGTLKTKLDMKPYENEHIARKEVPRLRKLKLAIVEIHGHVRDLKLPSVGNDDVAIGQLAAEHLLERRLEHFAYSGYPDQPWSALRRWGFGDAVREAGYICESHGHPRLFPTPKTWERAQRELLGWLKRLPKPVGLMACSDRHARNVLDACRRANLEVPDEVAVIGSDNDELLCRVSDPQGGTVS